MGLRSLRSRERGSRIPSGTDPFSVGAPNLLMLDNFSLCFRICNACFGFPRSSWLFASICSDLFSMFPRFLFDFGKVFGRFFDCFEYFFQKIGKGVEVNKTLRGRMNFTGRLLKKQANSVTKLQNKRMQIYDQKKNKPLNYSKI